MKTRTTTAVLLVGVLGVAAYVDDDDATATAGTHAATPTSSPAGDVLFEETFDDDRNGWGIVDDPDYGSTAYGLGDYVWDFRGRVAHLLPEVLGVQYDEGELQMLDVIVRAEVTILDGDGVVGVFCRDVPDTDAEFQWYEFVARDGFAAIRNADLEGNLTVLAETDEVSLPSGEPFAIEAACVDGANGDAHLTLNLNGESVLDATDDDPLGNGPPGLQAWTFPAHEPMEIRWHEFSVSSPPA